MSDSASTVKDGRTMKTIPRQQIESAPKPEPKPRNPQVVIGAIRENTERIVQGVGTAAIDIIRAQRILALLDELDSALLTSMLTKSLEGK